MATIMTPPLEVDDVPDVTTDSGGLRFVNIRANLMPEEVLVARRTEKMRRKVLLGLAVMAALVIAGYGFSWLQTQSANGDLDSLHHGTTALQNQLNSPKYLKLVQAETDAQAISSQLGTLMVGDLPWQPMMTQLRTQAPAGITLTNVAALVPSTAAASGTSTITVDPLNQTGKQQVGTITIQGTAPSKAAIARYADNLNKIKGVVGAGPTSVTVASGGLTFTVSAVLTTDALGGRYAVAATTTTTGGK